MHIERGTEITFENISTLKNEGERLFAEACLTSGCVLFHPVQVGESEIDFWVINPKSQSPGKLVEVTLEDEADLDKKTVTKKISGKKKKVPNKTGERKKRQIENMSESGHSWTILFRTHLENIRHSK